MATDPFRLKAQASLARQEGLGAARGLVHGIVFTFGIWLALMGFLLLVFH